jgi:AbrB family looped-hinge helix DNA binding protein
VETTKLSTKGQILLPKSIRDRHNWVPGIEFTIEDTPQGLLLRPLKPFKPTRHEDVYGCAGYSGPAKTLEEMDQGILEEAKKRHARGRY